MQLVECVPNFSEGRDLNIIKQITDQIEACEGVTLLDVDPGKDTNRTVVTFVGSPDAVAEAAFACIKKASEVIDMKKHTGAHARMGACDVCPFVPISGMTTEDAIELSKRVGKKVGEELGIPIYLYELSAQKEDRRNLAVVRKGEYEGLSEKFKDPNWKPDFGPCEFNAKSGATAMGVREFLIAYNLNLNTKNTKLANKIAYELREAGFAKRDEKGKLVKDDFGENVMVPGKFKCVKAVGWYIDEYKRAQISINFTNYKVSSIHKVYDEACKIADKNGVRITGSELVGLIPKDAMIQAGMHYLRKAKASRAIPEKDVIETAVQSLGLSEISAFNINEKIIEYKIKAETPLVSMKLDEFADLLSTDAPAPGGGSVAALCGSLSAALGAMVANLTIGKKGYIEASLTLRKIAPPLQIIKDKMLKAIDDDTFAFTRVMECFSMPSATDLEKQIKDEALLNATKGATEVPFSVLKDTLEIVDAVKEIAKVGNINSASDAGVAGLCALACAKGAYYNVLINLAGIKNKEYVEKMRCESDEILAKVSGACDEIEKVTRERIASL
ncbi:MAG: glutamate formimidoyltransferase [Pseudomonadota bacterium]